MTKPGAKDCTAVQTEGAKGRAPKMKRTVFILLFSLSCGGACSLHKATQPAAPADPNSPAVQPAPRKKLFSLPLPPQDGEDHFWEQNWRNNG